MDAANAFDLGIRQKGETYSIGLQAFVINATQTFASDIPTTLTVKNVPEGRDVKGIELNYKQAIKNWTIFGAATVQQCKYSLSNAGANGFPSIGFIKDDAACVGIANENLFSELSYNPDSALTLAGNVRVKSGWTGYYANPNVTGSGTDDHIAGSWLFGLNGSYKFTKQAVGLSLENLFNRRYISGLAPELESVSSSSGRYFIGSPRSFYLWYRLDL
jgi:iron complex outermembrane receptor protein